MRALLDVNVWIALFDDAHQFSDRANAFVDARGAKIATCPRVENGVIRVLSLPGYGRRGGLPMQRVRERGNTAGPPERLRPLTGPQRTGRALPHARAQLLQK